MSRCQARTQVFSRVVGYYSPVSQWNPGKRDEYAARRPFDLSKPGTARCAPTKPVPAPEPHDWEDRDR